MEFAPCMAVVTKGWPFVILAICVAIIIFLITKLRVHPFLALVGVLISAGILTTCPSS